MFGIATTLARWGAEGGWAGGWGGPWWLLIPLLWLVVASVAVWAFARRRNVPLAGGSSAVDILAARYARGEIDTDEYRQRLDELKGLR
ncbi:MAG TPA: SHOCT domain-containing protein [Acidimicrobiia bacterium]|jgi:putative membrane protein|nr:SHOCT domain-containing protein [Acidimicrobiia bacterium]